MNKLKIALGGTFDRLHVGHKVLLTIAARLGKKLYIAVTTDAYITSSKKQAKEKIEPYNFRVKRVLDYVNSIDPTIEVVILPLEYKDHDLEFTPPLDADAILVSEETYKQALRINERRKLLHKPPLDIILIPTVLTKHGRISSTYLRLKNQTTEDNTN